MGKEDHIRHAPDQIFAAVFTITSSRTKKTDASGSWITARLEKEGIQITDYKLIPDDESKIRRATQHIVKKGLNLLILTGGTGIAGSDVTIEAVAPLFSKKLDSFGAIFAQLSYKEIGSAAILSRACAGIIKKTAVFCIPGSLAASKLAIDTLILPEIRHVVAHVTPVRRW